MRIQVGQLDGLLDLESGRPRPVNSLIKPFMRSLEFDMDVRLGTLDVPSR